MKILFFFMESVFPRHSHGGSTTILKDLALSLGKRGDEVTIVCRQRSNNKEKFRIHPKVRVLPILRFKEVFPDAYFTPPYNISSALCQIYNLSKENDLFINFDSNFIFNEIINRQIPIINCLHDFVYSGALQGSFLFRRDLIIVNSKFVKDSLLATVGSLFPYLSTRIILIPNGIDTRLFKRVRPKQIYDHLPIKNEKRPILLCPHRPELGKGIYEAIKVTYLLKTKHKYRNIKLLIPIGLDERFSPEIKRFYSNLRKYIFKNSLTNNIIFHSWISQELMPQYYSLGDITLCLGNQIESFGNVPLESILCETPVIITRIGAYRTVLPEWCVSKIDPGEINQATKLINKFIKKKPILDKQIHYVKRFFNKDKMIKKYQKIIDKGMINNALQFNRPTLKGNRSIRFTLSPWCYFSRKGVYNDYLKLYRKRDKFLKFIEHNKFFNLSKAKEYGFYSSQILRELRNGFISIKNGD